MLIEWLISGVARNWVEDNFENGGYVYDTLARRFIRDFCEVKISYLCRGDSRNRILRPLQFTRYVLRSRRHKEIGDVVVRDPFSTVFVPFDNSRRQILLVHHIDFRSSNWRWLYQKIGQTFLKRVLSADTVVTVSEYWNRYFRDLGCANVVTIYNSFNLSLFQFDDCKLAEFRRKYNFPEKKPIIYLGNSHEEKGYRAVYHALRHMDVHFVTTGKKPVDLPIQNLFLPYQEYLYLLNSSKLVITMSSLPEGWCRIAHEAMLCGTPVIGSGTGGMGELLRGGGQIICPQLNLLPSCVTEILSNFEAMKNLSATGKEYAKQYDLEYFKNAWLDLVIGQFN